MKDHAIVQIDLSTYYTEVAKLADLSRYQAMAISQAGEGNEVVLTGAAPVWLYLKVAHVLHGKAKRLIYRSPVSGDVEVFNHDPN